MIIQALYFFFFLATKPAEAVLEKFETFLVDWKNVTTERKIRGLRSDNARELENKGRKKWLKELMIFYGILFLESTAK